MTHEAAIVGAFIRPDRRRRWLELLDSQRGRDKLRCHLAHCEDDLDPRFVHRIPDDGQKKEQILALPRERDAGTMCYALSESDDLDGRELPLVEALDAVVGWGLATFLSIDPGRLAYFEGEEAKARFLCLRDC